MTTKTSVPKTNIIRSPAIITKPIDAQDSVIQYLANDWLK